MTKLPVAKSSEIVYDRSGLLILVSSTSIDLTTAATAQDHFVVPVAGTVVHAFANIVAAPGTAAATIFCGPLSDTDKIIDDYSVGTSHATGFLDLTIAASDVAAGDVIVFGTDGGGSSTGSAVAGIVIAPTQQAG